jgi:hypothetical protein
MQVNYKQTLGEMLSANELNKRRFYACATGFIQLGSLFAELLTLRLTG